MAYSDITSLVADLNDIKIEHHYQTAIATRIQGRSTTLILRNLHGKTWSLKLVRQHETIGEEFSNSLEAALLRLTIKIGIDTDLAGLLLLPFARAWNIGLPEDGIRVFRQTSVEQQQCLDALVATLNNQALADEATAKA